MVANTHILVYYIANQKYFLISFQSCKKMNMKIHRKYGLHDINDFHLSLNNNLCNDVCTKIKTLRGFSESFFILKILVHFV